MPGPERALSFGDRERVLAALEVALREGVVEFDDARLRFAHPLLASVCYEQAPVWKRRAVHRALVGAVADVEEQARHLALAADGPDAVAASRLESAAERAAARGATAAAAELAELAAELTPDDPPLARGRRLRAATFHRLAGSADGAIALLNELLGETDRARAHIERHEQRSRAIGSPWSAAVSARSRGLLAAAEGDYPAAFAALDQSLSDLNGLQLPLERARTLLALGVVRRQAQQRRAAREALDQAFAIFEQTGARLWADKARAETRRIAGRRATPDWLTQTEQRVAALAAQGRSNKEIAAELFMGISTVEMHLTRAYRKLGIRSRGGLAGKLAVSRDATA